MVALKTTITYTLSVFEALQHQKNRQRRWVDLKG